MTDSERRLITILRSRKAIGMSDRKYAPTIGITPAYWSQLQSGARRLGKRGARAIRDKCPDLWREIDDVLFPRDQEAA